MFTSIKEYSHLYMFSTNMRPVTATMVLGPGGHGAGRLKLFRLSGKPMAATEEEEGLTSNRDFALVSGSVECYKVTGYIKQDMLATINTNFASVSLLTWKAGDDLHHSSGDLCNCDFQPEGLERDSDHVGQGEGGESQHRSEDGGHTGGDQGQGRQSAESQQHSVPKPNPLAPRNFV